MKKFSLFAFLTFWAFSINAQDANTFTKQAVERYSMALQKIENQQNFKNESAHLDAYFDAVVTYWKDLSPTWAYSMGEKKYAGRLWNNSLKVNDLTKEVDLKSLTIIEAFDKDELDKSYQVNLSLLQRELQLNQERSEHNLNLLAIENQWGIHNSMASTLGDISIDDKKDLAHAMGILEGTDRMFENAIETLQEGINQSMIKPKVTVNKVSAQLQNMLDRKGEESPFYTPFKNLPASFSDGEKSRIQTEAKTIIADKIIPAVHKLKDFFDKEYYPKCSDDIAHSALPNGDEKYAYQINYHTTTNMSAKEIHEKGLTEVKRIKGEMEAIIKSTGFEGGFEEFNEFLRTNPQFYYTEGDDLLAGYRDLSKRIDPLLIKYFGNLPRTPYGVKAIPDFLEKSATTAYYSGGSYKAGTPGYFYANTYALESRPKWEMAALTLHEAVPGHHLQIALADEIENLPEFRKFISSTAYVEGWALYAESLGDEMGLYDDPYTKYGQLTYEIWRAIRLVVDTGIHALGWTEEEAISFFKANSPRTEYDIAIEVNRYISWPGQALGYKIGELKIKELRAYAEKELGDDFDIRAFHDVILEQGVVPLGVLEEMVMNWIKEQ